MADKELSTVSDAKYVRTIVEAAASGRPLRHRRKGHDRGGRGGAYDWSEFTVHNVATLNFAHYEYEPEPALIHFEELDNGHWSFTREGRHIQRFADPEQMARSYAAIYHRLELTDLEVERLRTRLKHEEEDA